MSDVLGQGKWVTFESVDDTNWEDVHELDILRTSVPEMGGWFVRPEPASTWSTVLIRSRRDGTAVGVLDAMALPGYPGVANVSIFMNRAAAPTTWGMDAYGIYVSYLFSQGVRLIHHEVLEMNRPVHRILRGILLEPTAHLREHGYSAGRWWDVLVYSYDITHWQRALGKFSTRELAHLSLPG